MSLPTLWSVKIQQQATITGFSKELAEDIAQRLSELGFHNGTLITCLRAMPLGGPMVYQIGDSVFSLTRELAEKISIQNVDHN